jgi:hypothetical protein
MTAKIVNNFARVEKATKSASFKNMKHAAASIRKTAVASIQMDKTPIGTIRVRNKRGQWVTKKRYRPSPVGTPPRGHKSIMFFRRGIKFEATESSAIIGPAQSETGDVMAIQEHGLMSRGAQYDKRPTMFPAMEENLSRLHSDWGGAIGE